MPTYSYKIKAETEGNFSGVYPILAGEDIPMSGSNSKLTGKAESLAFSGNLKGSIDVRAISGTKFSITITKLDDDDKEIFKAENQKTVKGQKIVNVDCSPV